MYGGAGGLHGFVRLCDLTAGTALLQLPHHGCHIARRSADGPSVSWTDSCSWSESLRPANGARRMHYALCMVGDVG